MTKTDIAKALQKISQHLDEEANVAEAVDAITALILKFNSGKMPRKTPSRNKSTLVFHIEEIFEWDSKPSKRTVTTVQGWQRAFDDNSENYEQIVDFKVFDANRKLIAHFCRDQEFVVTVNKGR